MRSTSRILLAALTVFWAGARGASAEDPLPPPRAVPGSGSPTAPPARPLAALSAPGDYRLAAGDEIEVEVLVPPEAQAANPIPEAKHVIVAASGLVNLPKVRDLRLDGRTVDDVGREISEKLAKAGVTAHADVYVTVVRYAPRFVYLVGAAFERIEVAPSGRANLFQVLAQAGERMKDIDPHRVSVIPGGGAPPRTLDLTAYLARGGASAVELLVDAGDYIVLQPKPPEPEPQRQRVFILGSVNKPGAFQFLAENSRPITLLQLVSYAGGASQYGDLSAVTIRRFDPGNPQGVTFKVDVMKILKKGEPDVPLQANDIVFVDD